MEQKTDFQKTRALLALVVKAYLPTIRNLQRANLKHHIHSLEIPQKEELEELLRRFATQYTNADILRIIEIEDFKDILFWLPEM